MSDTLKPDRPESGGDWDWDFEGARRHHLEQGLRMTPEERLRWLEETVEEMQPAGAGAEGKAGLRRLSRAAHALQEHLYIPPQDRKVTLDHSPDLFQVLLQASNPLLLPGNPAKRLIPFLK